MLPGVSARIEGLKTGFPAKMHCPEKAFFGYISAPEKRSLPF
jgi:hypothetical protein